jgi:type I restriction enzyme S subunit
MKLRKDMWKLDKIGNVCQVISGGTPSRNVLEYFGGDIAWFTPTEIPKNKIEEVILSEENITELGLKKSSAKVLPKGTVLLTSRATIGMIAIAGTEITTNQGFANFICNDKTLYNWYLAYWLNSKVGLIKSLSSGTTFKEISKTTIRNLDIPLPPLEEQKQIAALFQSIETATEQVDGQEKNLKALQKTLVNGLLSKEPVFGNLLNSKNCTATSFGEIAECDKKYPEHEKEVERFVGLEWIEADNFQLQGWGEIANGTTFSKRFVKGDVLFGKRRAYLKKVAVADFDGICSGDILVIRAKAKKMLQGLLPYYISADAFIQHAVSTSAGSLSPRTKWKDLAELQVSIPDLKIQPIILEVLHQLDNTVNQLKQQKTTLKNLKQKLLNEILG